MPRCIYLGIPHRLQVDGTGNMSLSVCCRDTSIQSGLRSTLLQLNVCYLLTAGLLWKRKQITLQRFQIGTTYNNDKEGVIQHIALARLEENVSNNRLIIF